MIERPQIDMTAIEDKIRASNIVAIIPARGGSKSIPKKNAIDFCGKPLIAWSIEQALASKYIDDVYVTTDDDEIAGISRTYGAEIVLRPDHLATDLATSETALLHAISEIENKKGVDVVVFLQATSPIRETADIDNALEEFFAKNADSLFSASVLEDSCIWEVDGREFKSVTFDYKNRGRRQDRKPHYLENGSIYVFNTRTIKEYNNRLGGVMAIYEMPPWKSLEIDSFEDLELCKRYMKDRVLSQS